MNEQKYRKYVNMKNVIDNKINDNIEHENIINMTNCLMN
mgnify:CR=1 FL=1